MSVEPARDPLPVVFRLMVSVCVIVLLAGVAMSVSVLFPRDWRVDVVVPALAVITATLVLLLTYRGYRVVGRPRVPDRGSEHENRFNAIVTKVTESALDSESTGRKLAIQVGDTLAATARIASRTATGSERVQRLADQVGDGASAVEEIQAAIESLAQRIGEQGDVVTRSAAAVEEMSASIENVAVVAREKRTAAQQLLETTNEGSRTVTATGKIIGEVVDQVGSVHTMIDIIDDIAARTNLLAMNAAIEAAHAGASGRGFAVVAGEIRKLAERTAENARQIAGTLKMLRTKIDEARIAGLETGNAFSHIERGAREVTDAFHEIGAATDELSSGTGEVVSAVETLRTLSREIVGSAEEMRVGAREVTEVISATRDTAADTVEMINVTGESSTNVTEATDRISALSVANNEQVERLIILLQSYQDTAGEMEENARYRLRLLTMMLTHISQVARVRLMMDQRRTIDPDVVGDHETCDLGRWLALEGKRTIADPSAYRRIQEAHRTLHRIASELAQPESDTGSGEREEKFIELLEASQTITEMLTAFQTTDSVQWTPEVAVHVDVFDAHHRRLFELIDALYRSLQSGAGGAVLANVFDELIAYTGYHFSSEEAAFEHFKYPQCAQHRVAHAELVERVTELRADIDKGKSLVAVDVMEFLRDWVTRHIKKCDKLYSTFFAERDVNGFLSRRAGHNAERLSADQESGVSAVHEQE